jgi:hypothetical protein
MNQSARRTNHLKVFLQRFAERVEGRGMNKLNTGFTRIKDEELDNKADTVINALTGNLNFPGVAALLAALVLALKNFRDALAMPPGPARDAAIAETRPVLTTQLEQMARTLELTPDVTDAMLATTGFDMRAPVVRTGAAVDAPGDVRLKLTGTSGQVQVLFASVNRAKSYEVQFSLDPSTGQWTDAGTFGSSRNLFLNGLPRAKDVWVRVRAVGPDGPGGWSDPATILVA